MLLLLFLYSPVIELNLISQFPKAPRELEFTVSDTKFDHWKLLGTETVFDVTQEKTELSAST